MPGIRFFRKLELNLKISNWAWDQKFWARFSSNENHFDFYDAIFQLKRKKVSSEDNELTQTNRYKTFVTGLARQNVNQAMMVRTRFV